MAYDLYRDDGINPSPDLEKNLTRVSLSADAAAGSAVPGVAISEVLL